MRKFLMVFLFPALIGAQTLVSSISVDTSQYIVTGAVNEYMNVNGGLATVVCYNLGNQAGYIAAMNKSSRYIDVYNCATGSKVTLTKFSEIHYSTSIYLSQFYLDNDSGWECILNYVDTSAGNYTADRFKVIDDNGTQLLADNGLASYAFDGSNSYVRSFTRPNYKTWRFRTGVQGVAKSLAKNAAEIQPGYSFEPTGALNINFQPLGNGQTSIQLMDLLGRVVYSGVLPKGFAGNLTIPETSLPKSPFISKVTTNNKDYVRKLIPVR
jgi:hypothetical protein